MPPRPSSRTISNPGTCTPPAGTSVVLCGWVAESAARVGVSPGADGGGGTVAVTGPSPAATGARDSVAGSGRLLPVPSAAGAGIGVAWPQPGHRTSLPARWAAARIFRPQDAHAKSIMKAPLPDGTGVSANPLL